MINIVWLGLILIGAVVALFHGQADLVTKSAFDGAGQAVDTTIGLMGVMSLWLGIMRIAEKSGLVEKIAWLLRPLTTRLIPSVPPDHPAMGSIVMNLAANILGVGGAATPFGLKAMAELQDLNDDKDQASPAMCTFLALNTTAITLVPATVIAFRALAGSQNPAEIVLPTILATVVSQVVAILVDYYFRSRLKPPTPGGKSYV